LYLLMALASLCLVLTLFFFLAPRPAAAHPAADGPSFQVNAGFETRYRHGNWVPVQISLRNDGPDFNGTLSLSPVLPQYLGQSASNYQLPLSLPAGTQKQVTMYLPLYFDIQSVAVKLLDSNGNAIKSQMATLNPLPPGSVLVGVLSDQTAGFGPLSTAPLPDQDSSLVLEFLNASTLPTLAAALKNFDAIVLDNFTTANLSTAQLTALQTWVYHGGTLILAGGPQWRQTLAPLPADLVPVALNGLAAIAPGTPLLFPNSPGASSPAIHAPVTISTATIPPPVSAHFTSDEVILAAGAVPLMVQAHRGQGTILYLAFDPTLGPILNWQGAGALWSNLLLRGIGDQLLALASTSSGTTNYSELEQPLLAYRMGTLLQASLPGTAALPWLSLFIVFAVYLLVLGVVRFLLVRKLKRRDWSWRIVLSSIVVFSLLGYGLTAIERGAAIVSNSITIARLGQNGLPASLTTYMGVFVAHGGNFDIHISGNVLAQPSPAILPSTEGKYIAPSGESATKIIPVHDGTDLTLQDAGSWTLHPILFERDQQMPESLVSHLTIQNGLLVGSVSNTLGYALDDAFLLLPNAALRLGHLATGQAKQIRLKLSSSPLPPDATLADLIAKITRSPASDALPASPRNTWQRHLAALYALDDEGSTSPPPPCTGPCATPVPVLPFLPALPASASPASTGALNPIVTAGWPSMNTTDNDPLLVPGSPATLIGWAENTVDSSEGVSINGMNPAGLHETLIQAPLAINLLDTLNLPPNFIAGQLVAAEGTSSQAAYPGMYTLSSGSMTFEYDLPGISGMRISGLSIAEPPNLDLYDQSGTVQDPDLLPFYLYNWHKHAWDSISLSQSIFTTGAVSAYIGPGGRVLVQLNNEIQDSWFGPITFGKPLLSLQGLVSNRSPSPAHGQQVGQEGG
jgi:hypothetical protein